MRVTSRLIDPVQVMSLPGVAFSNSTIAMINDAEDDEQNLFVTLNGGASATVNGVTAGNIAVNAAGVVTADVEAAPGATNADFTLRVTDSDSLLAEATLNIRVAPDATAPVITWPAWDGSSGRRVAVVVRRNGLKLTTLLVSNEFNRMVATVSADGVRGQGSLSILR